jgi:rod shape determining protein RodA
MATQPRIFTVTSAAEPRRRLSADAGEYLRHLDYLLLAAVAGLVAYGLWVVQNVTSRDVHGDPGYFVRKQAIFVVLGFAAFVVTAVIDPERYRRFRHLLLGVTIILMLAVFTFGEDVRGSHRWINLGFFQLQPSELGKVVVVASVAGFLATRGKAVTSFSSVVGALGIGAVPVLLVFFEPDFGTAMIYVAGVVGVLYFAGARWQHLVSLAALGAGLATAVLWILPAQGVQVLKPYQVDRLVGFIHPDADPRGTTYNVNQAITAVGSGGLDGRGVAGATQTAQDFLPEHHTDFIFSSLAEQRGFLGAAILLLLYAIVVWRGIKIIALAETLFQATLAGAIITMLLFQIFLNVGMNTGIAPITGITLPFISYGGSSMIVSLATMGILQAIHARGRLANRR